MSESKDSLVLEYRKFVAWFAKQLKVEEIYEVAFIWLRNRGDISIYEPKEKPCGLKLFVALECLGIFSWREMVGLVEIAKSVNRFDLVKNVESFTKKNGRSCGKRYSKKRDSSEIEERRQLETAHERMVLKSTELEVCISDLQTVLRKRDLATDDGVRVVLSAEAIAKGLAAELDAVWTELQRRSREESSTSSSSDGSEGNRRNSGDVSAPVPECAQGIIPYLLQVCIAR